MNAYHDRALSALGDPTRRTLFELVAIKPRAVGELAEFVPVSRPAVSQHLAILREAGLVLDRRAGSRRIYHANPEALAALREYFDQFWDHALAAFAAAAEQEETP